MGLRFVHEELSDRCSHRRYYNSYHTGEYGTINTSGPKVNTGGLGNRNKQDGLFACVSRALIWISEGECSQVIIKVFQNEQILI